VKNNVTVILSAIEHGDAQAAERLLPLIYDELRRLAAQKLAQERPGQTLQATALVHEAYLRLVGDGLNKQQWNSRNHFFAAAAEAMRRILVESARRKCAGKRGGGRPAVPIDEVDSIEMELAVEPLELLAIDEALERLRQEDAVKAELVKLRYFAGMSIEEASAILGISRATAARYWDYARSWLYSELNAGESSDNPSYS
jgi:RNA polymerase sigma factor (TIGR02999 family)